MGLTAHTLASVYGEEPGQGVSDEEWLTLAGERGWPTLMKDDSIRRRPAELDALRAAGAQVFCVTNASLTGRLLAARLVDNRHRIVQRCRRPGPSIYGVYDGELRLLWSPRR